MRCNGHLYYVYNSGGLELHGRRCTAASYIYSEAKLCLFCSQLFNVSEDDTSDSSMQRPPVVSTENIDFRLEQNDQSQQPGYNPPASGT